MHPAQQRYDCGDCGRQFDDLTDSIFAEPDAFANLDCLSLSDGTQSLEPAGCSGTELT